MAINAAIIKPMNFGSSKAIPEAMRFGPGQAARENAAHLDAFFDKASRESTGFLGADGVYSIGVGDRTLFAFGDTFFGGRIGGIQTPPSRLNFVRHSIGVADGDTFHSALPSVRDRLTNHRDWLEPPDIDPPLIGSKDWYWPGAMHQSEGGIQMMLGRYHLGTCDPRWGWDRLRTDVATLDPETLALRSIKTVVNDGDTSWGAATLSTPDHLYMYGAHRAEGDSAKLRVARTADQDAASGWSYLAKDGSWSDDVRDAASSDVVAANQFSVLDNPRGGVDLVIQDGFTPQITVTHGETPAGPWDTAGAKSFDVPSVKHPTYVYNSLVHESLSDADRLVVSTNQNTFSIKDMIFKPDVYHPRFTTIPRPGTPDFPQETKLAWGE